MRLSTKSLEGCDGLKSKRQTEILAIIQQERVETQDQLLALLLSRGVSATQATISRDIKELHLTKEVAGHGSFHYTVSTQHTAQNFELRLRTIFKEGVTSFDCAQNIVVLKTMPGLASAACAAVDAIGFDGLVGSLAGDDTVMLVLRDNEKAALFCHEVHEMLQ